MQCIESCDVYIYIYKSTDRLSTMLLKTGNTAII